MKNTKSKINLAVIFGGVSAEHEVSIESARNIVAAINKNRYQVTLVGIDKMGNWISVAKDELLSGKNVFENKKKSSRNIVFPATHNGEFFLSIGKIQKKIDVVFPVLHGPNGEDGTIQGLFKLYNAPFVGCGVLGSALGMDKEVSKRLLIQAGIPVVPYLSYDISQKAKIKFSTIKKILGLPFFVKPANLGSSVGISKVKGDNEFKKAIDTAFRCDHKIILEKNIDGREIECSVLGNRDPKASIAGEIIPNHDFYSYEAKYLDENGAILRIPAEINRKTTEKIRKMAVQVFKVLCCEGLGRVDFFLIGDDEIYVNEINTIPGFTTISMYPKLWEKSGITYAELIDKLVSLAIERHSRDSRLKYSPCSFPRNI